MNIGLFHKLIFAWFRQHGRILPWRKREGRDSPSEHSEPGECPPRHFPLNPKLVEVRDQTLASYFVSTWNRDPYRVIVSELMLQQTQVDRVLPKFEAFVKKWPTVRSLAAAKLSDILIMWQGLGYNRRARFLHEMAQTVTQKYDGIFPKNEHELIELPGIGQYTARAVLAFAYGKDVGVVDTNTKRIFSRTLFGAEPSELVQLAISPKDFLASVDECVPKSKGDPWNQALMDFGALVCTARSPKCSICPLQTTCKANQRAKVEHFTDYAAKLSQMVKKSQKNTLPTTPKQKFQDTDRYYRGRVIDKLREGSLHMQELQVFIEKNHGLADRARWGVIIEGLVIDKLLVIRGSIVSLD